MSTRTTRSRVQGVSNTALPVTLAGGAIAAAALIAVAVRALSREGKMAFDIASKKVDAKETNLIAPVCVLRQENQTHAQTIKPLVAASRLTSLEAAKVEALASIVSTPYLITTRTAHQELFAAFIEASSIIELRQAETELRQNLESEHQHLFTSALVEACSTAARNIGFEVIETMPSPLPSTVRVVASDQAGRNLITEINVDSGRETNLETEVLGVSDGSCNAIMDQFDLALEAQGVRSNPPERKFTGGVCETAAARAFLRNRPQKVQEAQTQPMSNSRQDDARRRQRLNPTIQKQR